MMKNPKCLVLMLLSFLLPTAVVYAMLGSVTEGITLPMTRIIYHENEKNGITFTVTNNTEKVYLLQSRVINEGDDAEPDDPVPFIVVPPLTRFEPGDSVTLLIRQADKRIMNDRESLWRLALKTIPAQQDKNKSETQDGGTSLVLALQNNLKLFYRPTGMTEMTVDERAERLQFMRRDGYLTVSNPTPYHVTLGELTANGKPVTTDGVRMIAPYSSVSYPAEGTVSVVSWRVIDDNSRQSETHQQSLL